MITLKNNYLTAKFIEKGAELKSLVYNEKEYIWEGKEEIWNGSCPILFPICGGVKEDKYILNEKEYSLVKHGFARKKDFIVEELTESAVTFLLKADEDTKKGYPFDFELRVTYTLEEKTLKVQYNILNKSDATMYYNIGSHEGYYTPEGIEDYDVIFPEKETLNTSVVYGNLVSNQTMPIIKESNVLPLYEKYFTIDALVFKDVKSNTMTLRNRKTGKAIKVDFPNSEYLLIWHKPNAPFICLEPWNGLPDITGSSYDLTEKEGIKKISAKSEVINTHSITIIQ